MGAAVRLKPRPGAWVVPAYKGASYRYVGALGVRWDATTGLYYMRHRWYDPQLQQFMSADPLKSNADLYEYANDGPARLNDPSGLFAFNTSILGRLRESKVKYIRSGPRRFLDECIVKMVSTLEKVRRRGGLSRFELNAIEYVPQFYVTDPSARKKLSVSKHDAGFTVGYSKTQDSGRIGLAYARPSESDHNSTVGAIGFYELGVHQMEALNSKERSVLRFASHIFHELMHWFADEGGLGEKFIDNYPVQETWIQHRERKWFGPTEGLGEDAEVVK